MGLEVQKEAQGLIFDLDGTLSNSMPVHLLSWDVVGEKFGFKFDPKIENEMTGRPIIEYARRIVEQYHINATLEEIVDIKHDAFWNLMYLLMPVDEVIAIVKKYHGKLPMAVGTGANRKSAEIQLKTLKLTEYFDVIVSANDVTNHKPDPDTFLECARLIGIAPKYCQVFEDGEVGIAAAKKAGMIVTNIRPFIKYREWILS